MKKIEKMEICFLGQGFTDISDESIEKTLVHSLGNGDFNRFTAIVAFASEGGVERVINQIKNENNHFKQVEFYIGIDNQVTSYEALNLLLESEIDCYIYHTVSQHIIFHSKIYIFEGEKKGKIIIGSSNLTKSGLSQNMEASLVVDFEMDDEQGVVLLNKIKKHYHLLLAKISPNIKKLTTELLDLFVKLKKVPKGKRGKTESGKNKTPQDEELLAKFNEMFPPVKIPRNTPKSTKRKISYVRNWQSTDPKKPHYRHPDVGSTPEALQTKLTDKEGKVVKNGDVVEWTVRQGEYKGTTFYGIVTNLTHNSGGKRYKDKHPRYHVFANVTIDGKETVVNKQVKIERVKKHDPSGALAKQIRKSQE